MSSRILIQFGKRVREERTKHGISQERLGELAKVHRTYVGMIERAIKEITDTNVSVIFFILERAHEGSTITWSVPVQDTFVRLWLQNYL